MATDDNGIGTRPLNSPQPPLTLSCEEKRIRLFNGEPLEFYNSEDDSQESNDHTYRIIHSSWLVELVQKDNYLVNKPIRIHNAIIIGDLSFRYVIFESEISITGSEFKGNVDFSFATFKRVVRFEGSKFWQAPNFRAVHAESYFYINRCCFPQFETSIFIDLRADENIYAEGSSFGGADFSRAKIGKVAFFGPSDKDNKISAVCYENDGCPVRFYGKAIFNDAHFGSTVEFQGAQFKGEAHFQGVRIDGSAFFYPTNETVTCFEKLVRFFYTSIRDNADFGSAIFKDDADFEHIEVGGYAYWGPHILGNVEFQRDRVAESINKDDLNKDRTSSTYESVDRGVQFLGEASFLRAKFSGAISFKNARFERDATFDGADVRGPAEFRRAVFKGPANFRESCFRAVLFRDALIGRTLKEDRQFNGPVTLRGFSCEFITVAWPELFSWQDGIERRALPGAENQPKPGAIFNYTAYHRQPYTHLEKVLRAMGHDREADEVYLARREREARLLWQRALGKEVSEKLSVRERFSELAVALFDTFQKVLFNYGIRPFRLLWLSMLVLAIGTCLFAQPGAVEHKDKEERVGVQKLSASQSFGVSFRLFIPIVELPTGNQWIPTQNPSPYFSFFNLSFTGYATLHRLAGAILVPLGIAALTGFMHRRAKS